MLADLRRVDAVERISLEGLGAAEVSEVVAAAAGHELDADGLVLAEQIASETDGNPFVVGEYRAAWSNRRAAVRRGQPRGGPSTAPSRHDCRTARAT